ncbi:MULTISPECIES: hypothetical protein [Planktothrix]|uniref:Uncharacterized protein n=1 Tax=Planktothrix rubescens CCAP 1459/22 TaxID=329571 RepID=A0A6J7ZR29_PLARU|nr:MULTISPECIES: hypothetical protein [Planktothrix]CAC5345377.1 hypothetical protein PLAN_60392 [Planktothrix rubescens NIVA-CYA 18]CAD0228418.1 conserved hypothetical protein [Planktothrix agardhii]CAD5932665.1 hypothetical protein NO758_01376 [Planktothrix agardhii]CAD5959839.1 hypothetical protein PCC7821_03090 [Planktothrix rubescens NIVA-CYA 18]
MQNKEANGLEIYQIKRLEKFDKSYNDLIKKHYRKSKKAEQEFRNLIEDFIKNPEFLSNPSSDSFSDSLSFPSDTSEDGFQFRKKRWRRLPSQPPDKDLKRQINLAKEDTKEYK